ncbi:MAG: endonuclease/exonuclease/phosphatase family protein [Myxococcales bacterium]|nr:endonuclease/exonuclease/phosphatase family protein [Myxococcales bacterium]MCB9642004.1 endonuclease/exonuclease/phosphatase family protein [Myxococcales bacterium]
MKTLWMIGKIALVLLVVLIAGGFILLRAMNFFPPDKMKAETACDGAKAVELKPGDKVKILSWNIQFGTSRKYHYFYDGGKDVIAEKDVVDATVKGIADVVEKLQPDIILWQEIDRNSKRSAYVDQLKKLWNPKRFACYATTPYFRSAYVPTPNHQHMGRVDMQLTIFSRYKLENPTRFALPMLKESFLRRAFNLKRAVLRAEIPIKGQKNPLVVFDTHFSAFSFGDGTLEKQVARFSELLQEAETQGSPWVAAGDFNMLPPGDNPKRLKPEEAKYYNSPETNPIQKMFKQFHSALSVDAYKKDKAKFNTYLPWGAKKTDRWIDHVFTSKKVKVETYQVVQSFLSDHLPIIFEVTIPK